MNNVVLLDDIRELRKRKISELTFYLAKKQDLEKRLFEIRRELKLTDDIIKLIEKE